jgi:aryl-alcohol dehydrogenase-like predicted oxidoreductase
MVLGHAADFEGARDLNSMRARAREVILFAYQRGVRYFDVARSYGRGEEFLADASLPGDAVIGSKWGYTYTADWRTAVAVHEVKEHSLAAFERQWAETRSLLNGRVAVYHIHSATLETGVLDDLALHRALARLNEQGIRVGLSVTGPRQADVIRKALTVRVDGEALFRSVQATWNLLERSAEAALAEAHAAGLGVIIKEALANGRLTPRGGFSDDAVALAAALAKEWADVVLSGAATVAQLQSNLRAFEITADGVAQALETTPVESPEEYWSRRGRLAWT